MSPANFTIPMVPKIESSPASSPSSVFALSPQTARPTRRTLPHRSHVIPARERIEPTNTPANAAGESFRKVFQRLVYPVDRATNRPDLRQRPGDGLYDGLGLLLNLYTGDGDGALNHARYRCVSGVSYGVGEVPDNPPEVRELVAQGLDRAMQRLHGRADSGKIRCSTTHQTAMYCVSTAWAIAS